MTAWQRRLLFAFAVFGLVFISRTEPEGSGDLQKTEFATTETTPEPAVSEEPVVVEATPAPVVRKSEKTEKLARRPATREQEPVPPSTYKRVIIDMTDYVPPEPPSSRFIASVEKKIKSPKGDFALANVIAVESSKFNASMGEEVEEKAGFTVYKPKNAVNPSFALEGVTRPVVVNRASGSIGIVTGTIVVRLKNFESAAEVASAFGLEEVSSDDTIDTVFYRVPAGREIDDLIELLREDHRVTRADAEIILATRQAF